MSYASTPPVIGSRPSSLTVPYRFRGPAGSANGGYVCGLIAGCLDGPVEVTLRRPPPLDTPMAVEPAGADAVRILHDGALVAEATAVQDWQRPAVPGAIAEARAAKGPARYFEDPAYPECFVCGRDRPPGDGLRIFPRAVNGVAMWAAAWTPDASTGLDSVHPEVVWAALDCPSGIAAVEATEVRADTTILLGRMTAEVTALPRVGDECQVIAWPIGQDGRKLMAGSALLGPDGEPLAVASAVWLTVPRPGSTS